MIKLIKICIAGIFLAVIFLLPGCNSSTTYYSGYYDPYPRWGYRHSHHYHYHPGRPSPPSRPDRRGKPVHLPAKPRPPRPTPRPARR